MGKYEIKAVDMPSKLDAHLEAVISLRREGKAWTQIAAELDKRGIKTSPQNLWKWFQRRQRKAQKVARELRPFEQLARVAPHSSPALPEKSQSSAPHSFRPPEIADMGHEADPFKPRPVERIIPSDQPSGDKPPQHEKFSVGDDILK